MHWFKNKYFSSDKWNIGYVEQSTHDFIENRGLNKDIKWLKETRSDYAADPFILPRHSSVYIYFEALNYLFSKGEIYVIKDFDISTKTKVNGIVPNNIHLSYPYIFEDQEKVYCIPETARSNQVGLYDIDPLNLTKLTKRRILLSGQPYVDSSIINYQNKYWLFTSIRGQPGAFYIYYADSLEADFKPHEANPIKTDCKSFRSAGKLFVLNNILYRPTQNQELTYGGSIRINKIAELSSTKYISEFLFEVLPEPPYTEGLHNISFKDDLIVFDSKRRFFSPFIPFYKLINKVIDNGESIMGNLKNFKQST